MGWTVIFFFFLITFLFQLFVDQMTPDVVAVTRHNPATHESVVLVAHTAFRKPNDSTGQGKIPPLKLDGSIQEIVFEAQMTRKDTRYYIREELRLVATTKCVTVF